MGGSAGSPRQVLRFDLGWRFHLGDINPPLPNTHVAAYMNNKAGWARGAGGRGYDDSDWRVVDLPHDWAVEQPPSPDEHMNGGYRPRGIGWYRRQFRLEEADRSRRIVLRFDGVATHCTVYVNGHLLHRNFCGYTPFDVDITDVAEFGDSLNVVAVRVDATYMEGWWYEGAGIYRHVWLIRTAPLYVEEDSVFVWPQPVDGERWRTVVQAAVCNRGDDASACEVRWQILDDQDRVIGETAVPVDVPSMGCAKAQSEIAVSNPRRWTLEEPALYRLRTTVVCDGEVVDEQTTRFGYRMIRFDADRGFFLNDEHVLLKGTCNHQDHAGVGVAVPDSLWRYRIRRLKEMGCNAIRCAHNPPAPELLDACDELGMLVMDENRNFGSSPQHLEQLRTLVRRDRNHPSVILWSLCNEEPIQTLPVSGRIARVMREAVRELDPSRPVTASVSGGILNDGCIGDELDVMSINYQLDQYDAYRARRPKMPVIAGETHCAYGTRGVVHSDPDRQIFAPIDAEAAPWGATGRRTWEHVRQRPWVGGLFIWTGFDYRGEPTPYAWPSISSHWGLIDLCGFPKDSFYLHKAFFSAEPFVHLFPHWTHPVTPGETVTVRAYSNCERVELWLNGRSLGAKGIDPVEMAAWDVVYEPGELTAVGYRDGREMARCVQQTAGAAVALGLELDDPQPVLPADGEYAAAITLFATDAAGRRVPTADHRVTIAVDGPAELIGTGNGDPNCHEPDKGNVRSLFNGLAQALIRTRTTAGPIIVRASADVLAPAEVRLQSVPAPIRPVVPIVPLRHFVTGWRMSPVSVDRPDPTSDAHAQDMNTWQPVDPHATAAPTWPSPGYAMYQAKLKLPRRFVATGAQVVFDRVVGEAQFFLDGQPIAHRPGTQPDQQIVDVPPSDQPRRLVVLIHATTTQAGLAGPVEILPPA